LKVSNRRPPTTCSLNTPMAFHERPGRMFSRGQRTWANVFGILPRFLENLLESEFVVYSTTVRKKTALDIRHLIFNYFVLSFLKALGIHFAPQCTAHARKSRLFLKPCLEATSFGRMICFTSWFHHRVTFLPVFAKPSCFCPHVRAADEAATALNSCHLTSMSAVHSEISRNKSNTLLQRSFFTILCAATSHFNR